MIGQIGHIMAALTVSCFFAQQHQKEMESLRVVLREKTKENKRIKSSLDSIKELNNTMKKQVGI